MIVILNFSIYAAKVSTEKLLSSKKKVPVLAANMD